MAKNLTINNIKAAKGNKYLFYNFLKFILFKLGMVIIGDTSELII